MTKKNVTVSPCFDRLSMTKKNVTVSPCFDGLGMTKNVSVSPCFDGLGMTKNVSVSPCFGWLNMTKKCHPEPCRRVGYRRIRLGNLPAAWGVGDPEDDYRMKALVASILLAGALLAASAPTVADAPATTPAVLDPQTSVLFKRMIALNASLRTYKADVHLDVALKSFPFISPSLDGTAYYKRPDREAVIFDTVPALASQFRKVYPRIDPPGDWLAIYEVYVMGDDTGTTTFRLVPRKNGRVDHLDVKVDDANATITGYVWTYKDGGFVAFDQSYRTLDGNFLVDKQTGHVELPSYKADVTSRFSNYQINVAVADSVFVQN